MSRSAKGYDILTFFICANIMGGLALPFIPVPLNVYGIESISTIFGLSFILGIIGGLIAAVAVSKIVPIGEKTVLYGVFSGTFIVCWTNLTLVVKSIETYMKVDFPLSTIVMTIGIILFIVTLFSMGGVDIEH